MLPRHCNIAQEYQTPVPSQSQPALIRHFCLSTDSVASSPCTKKASGDDTLMATEPVEHIVGVTEVEASQKLEHQTFDHVAVDFPI